jgi:hypothetical protein
MPSETNLLSTAGLYGTHHSAESPPTKQNVTVFPRGKIERKQNKLFLAFANERERERSESHTAGQNLNGSNQTSVPFRPWIGPLTKTGVIFHRFPTLLLVGRGTPCGFPDKYFKPLHSCENWTMPRSRHIQRPISKCQSYRCALVNGKSSAGAAFHAICHTVYHERIMSSRQSLQPQRPQIINLCPRYDRQRGFRWIARRSK